MVEGTAEPGRRRTLGASLLAGGLVAAGLGFAAGWFLVPPPDTDEHDEAIERAAREFGVDAALVRAVVLAESGGRADARSATGAVGLMQLMPATARERARELGLESFDLEDPETNVRIGTYHLSRLLAAFDGQIALAVAAYNAGESRVKKWARSASDLSAEAVVESMASDQTRGYVRRVLSFLAEEREG